MEFVERVVESFRPEDGSTGSKESIEALICDFHQYIANASEESSKSGILRPEPDVEKDVLLPNIATFRAVDGQQDPAIHMLHCAQQLFLLSTNTLAFLSHCMAVRNQQDMPTAEALQRFVRASNANMDQLMRLLFPVAKPTSRIILPNDVH